MTRPFLSTLLLASLLAATLAPSWAAPPRHAPAHGWRMQHDPYYQGYAGERWRQDYGIVAGRCNREAIGAVLGGVVGGVIGDRVGDGDVVAILIGGAIGAVLGARIGGELDRGDAACIGHALELARDGQRVSWRDDRGTSYQLRPLRGFSERGLPCREFELLVGNTLSRQSACQRERGVWELVR